VRGIEEIALETTELGGIASVSHLTDRERSRDKKERKRKEKERKRERE